MHINVNARSVSGRRCFWLRFSPRPVVRLNTDDKAKMKSTK